MSIINFVTLIFELILKFVSSSLFILILFVFIISYHILLFLIRDLKYLRILKKFENPKSILRCKFIKRSTIFSFPNKFGFT